MLVVQAVEESSAVGMEDGASIAGLVHGSALRRPAKNVAMQQSAL
jgi:hypothetical protein